MQSYARIGAIAALTLVVAAPAFAQVAPPAPPRILQIAREEVRPGKGAAHAANEAAWGAAFVKGQAPITWLAMRSIAGPSEVWFLTGWESWADREKADKALEANAALTAEDDKYSTLDGDNLSRTSTIFANYRPGLSYQPGVDLTKMRYMAVDVVRVKPGQGAAFAEAWRMMVEAHKTAKMNEHWAVYSVNAGMADGTYFFMYPSATLAELDASGPMHGSDEFSKAVGEGGRNKMNAATIASIDSETRLIFQLSPQMSSLAKTWADADPFWAPKAPAPAVVAAKKPGDKK